MKSLRSASLTVLLFLFFINTVQAAQDYKSSRSITTSAIEASDETDKILKVLSTYASAVAKNVISIEQRDGYSGQYLVNVEVHIRIERAKNDDNK